MAKRNRPDIRPLASSLLGEQRDFADSQRKGDNKDMLKVMLLNLGIGIGNRLLSKKADNFINEEPLRQQRIKYNNALNALEGSKTEQGSIDKHKGGASDYFVQKNVPTITTMTQNAMGDKFDAEAMKPWIDQQASMFASEQLASHNKVMELGRGLTDADDFQRFQEIRNNRARSVGNYAVDRAKALFTGKKAEDLEGQGIASIESSGMYQNAEALTHFKDVYTQTNDIRQSRRLADALEVLKTNYKESKEPFETTKIEDVDKTVDINGSDVPVMYERTTESNGTLTRSFLKPKGEKDRALVAKGQNPTRLSVSNKLVTDPLGNKVNVKTTTTITKLDGTEVTVFDVEPVAGLETKDPSHLERLSAITPETLAAQGATLGKTAARMGVDGEYQAFLDSGYFDYLPEGSESNYNMAELAANAEGFKEALQITDVQAQELAAQLFIGRLQQGKQEGNWSWSDPTLDSGIEYSPNFGPVETYMAAQDLNASRDQDITVPFNKFSPKFLEDFKSLPRAQQIQIYTTLQKDQISGSGKYTDLYATRKGALVGESIYQSIIKILSQ